jgi:hypothetical protein
MNSVENLSFTFNTLGNLIRQVDGVTGTTDTLSYDRLNRLTWVPPAIPACRSTVTKTVACDA